MCPFGRLLAEVEARKRRIEAEEFRTEFDAFMQSLEQVEQQDGNAPSMVLLPNE